MNPCEEFLDFIAQGLKVFGPSSRVRVYVGNMIGTFTLPPDPSWRAPAKRFRDTRNSARSIKRGNKHGKGKG